MTGMVMMGICLVIGMSSMQAPDSQLNRFLVKFSMEEEGKMRNDTMDTNVSLCSMG